MVGELVGLDGVGLPTYDWAGAAATAIRMCSRITGRATALVARSAGPERLRVIRNYCRPDITIEVLPFDYADGGLDIDACRATLSNETAALYVENPSYLGTVDARIREAAELVHSAGGLVVVGVDPISLGVMAPPPSYGADIVCGDLQPLGMHMSFGGGLAGFIATPDEERFVAEHPGILMGLTSTSVEGEYGFGYVRPDRTVYAKREHGNEFTGTTTGLWAITAAVYLALVGPQGLHDVGASILQRAHYAAGRIGELPGVTAPALGQPFFKEFVVNLDERGLSVADVNRALHGRGFYGGHPLRTEFPELGESALYCVTEVHTKQSIDSFVDALHDVLKDP
jgi:glycine dehydrogenase subunit 1